MNAPMAKPAGLPPPPAWMQPALVRLRGLVRRLPVQPPSLLAAVALDRLLLPRLDEWRPRVEHEASQAIGAKVSIGRILSRSGSWVPAFELDDVVLRDAQGREALRLPHVSAALSVPSLLAFRLRFEQLLIDGARLEVRRSWPLGVTAKTPSGLTATPFVAPNQISDSSLAQAIPWTETQPLERVVRWPALSTTATAPASSPARRPAAGWRRRRRRCGGRARFRTPLTPRTTARVRRRGLPAAGMQPRQRPSGRRTTRGPGAGSRPGTAGWSSSAGRARGR